MHRTGDTMTEQKPQASDTNQSFDFNNYANVLNGAVSRFFVLQDTVKKHAPHYTPSIIPTQDFEIDVGVSVARLKRSDVSEKEKHGLVKNAGDWLKYAARTLDQEIMTAVHDARMEDSAVDLEALFKELVSLESKMTEAGALQDRYEEQFDSAYMPWQRKFRRAGNMAERIGEIQSRTCQSLQMLIDADPSLAQNPSVERALNMMTAMHEGIMEQRDIEAQEEALHGKETVWRSYNVLRDEEQSRKYFIELSDRTHELILQDTPRNEFRLRKIIDTWRRDFQQEANRSYGTNLGIA